MRFFRTRAEPTEPPDPAAETLRVIARLRAGGRPSDAELSGAAVLERWRLFPGEPYMLQGWAGSSLKSGVAFALDIEAGWARLIDRWARLGAGAGVPPRVSNEAVMEAAERALAKDGPPPQPSPTRGEGVHRACGTSFPTMREGAHGVRGAAVRTMREGAHRARGGAFASEIAGEARALAEKAQAAGLDGAAYLLDMAALELDAARWP
jgi:hypothetical protein